MKGKDSLINFIEVHRNDFDTIEVPDQDQLWRDFVSDKHSVRTSVRYILAACLVTLLIALVALASYRQGRTDQVRIQALLMSDPHGQTYLQELLEDIHHQELKIKLKKIPQQSYTDLFSAVQEINILEEELKEELVVNPQERAILRTLLLQYERKAKLLRQILFEFEKENNYEKHVRASL